MRILGTRHYSPLPLHRLPLPKEEDSSDVMKLLPLLFAGPVAGSSLMPVVIEPSMMPSGSTAFTLILGDRYIFFFIMRLLFTVLFNDDNLFFRNGIYAYFFTIFFPLTT